jgi:hypothetical protein
VVTIGSRTRSVEILVAVMLCGSIISATNGSRILLTILKAVIGNWNNDSEYKKAISVEVEDNNNAQHSIEQSFCQRI